MVASTPKFLDSKIPVQFTDLPVEIQVMIFKLTLVHIIRRGEPGQAICSACDVDLDGNNLLPKRRTRIWEETIQDGWIGLSRTPGLLAPLHLISKDIHRNFMSFLEDEQSITLGFFFWDQCIDFKLFERALRIRSSYPAITSYIVGGSALGDDKKDLCRGIRMVIDQARQYPYRPAKISFMWWTSPQSSLIPSVPEHKFEATAILDVQAPSALQVQSEEKESVGIWFRDFWDTIERERADKKALV